MADALYRTYRPQTFADVVNQQHIKITLQHALEQDRVAHAYLFAGPRGIGKTTLARILARAVNCTTRGKSAEPCNACPMCTAILSNSNLDVIEIDAASQTGVDNVRENIIQGAHAIPAKAKRKVFIIDEVHMLSTSAFNALLKLLEEPPAHAMFILATTEVHRIPDTIISRTQRFDFKRIAVDDIVARLQRLALAEKRQLDDTVASRIARRAGGSVRDAETMLGQLFSFGDQRITNDVADLVIPKSDQQLILELLTAIVRDQTTVALERFHHFCDEGGDIPNLVAELILTSRALLLATVDPALIHQVATEIDSADIQQLLDLAKTTSVERLNVLVEALLTAQRRLTKAVMAELPVELAIISSTNGSGQPPDQSSSPPPTQPSPPKPRPSTPATPTTKKRSASGSQLTLQAVREAWQKIQRSIGLTHPSIGLSVQHAAIGDVTAEEVFLHVPFKLHADRLSDPKYGRPLNDALDEALGQPVRLSVVVAEVPETRAAAELPPVANPSAGKSSQPGDLWDSVVSSFSAS